MKRGKIAKYMGTYYGYPIFFKIETFGNKEKERELEQMLFDDINKKTLWQRIIRKLK